jgi:hypothetical protein
LKRRLDGLESPRLGVGLLRKLRVSGFLEELQLDEETREQLGLKPEEVVRLIQSDGRTLVIERVDESSGFAVPWDRELVLSANVQAFPMADVLSMLHRAGKSGFLLFGSEDHEKSVYLHRGEVVFAASNQQVDRLGECLFRGGVITLEQLRDAAKRWTPHARLGKVLVERGTLSPRELWNGVKLQVEEIVRSLFAYTSGSVFFWEGEVQPDNVVRLSLPTKRLISEGLSRRDELLRFLAALEDPVVRLVCAEAGSEGLSGSSRTMYDALQREPHFSAVCREVGVDPLSGARTVQMLRLSGAVKVVRDSGLASDGAGPSEPRAGQGTSTLRELILGHARLISELLAPLVMTDGVEAVYPRVESLLLETADRHPELLTGLSLGPGGDLDPEELLQRALRLPGEREGRVRAALGEIVAYLEFELRNHPRIDDPEIYLDALEDLRAKLDL